MWSPPLAFLPLPQGCPRISMTTYAPGAWGRKWLGLSRSYWGPPHLVVKPPEMVTAVHEDLVLGPAPEEGEVQKEAGCAVNDEVTQCTPPLGPSPRRKKPGRNSLLLTAKHVRDWRPFKNYLCFLRFRLHFDYLKASSWQQEQEMFLFAFVCLRRVIRCGFISVVWIHLGVELLSRKLRSCSALVATASFQRSCPNLDSHWKCVRAPSVFLNFGHSSGFMLPSFCGLSLYFSND